MKAGKRAIRLNDDDEVMFIGLTSGSGEDEILRQLEMVLPSNSLKKM